MFKTKPIKKVMAVVLSIILAMAIMPIPMIAANNNGHPGIAPHTNTTLRWVADSVEVPYDATYVDITIRLENAYSLTHGVLMTLALQGAAGLSLPADAYRGAVSPNAYTVTPQSILQNPAIFGMDFLGPFNPASVVNAIVRINLDAGLVANTPSYVLLSRPQANIHQTHQTFFSITRLPIPVHAVTFNLHGGTGAFPASFPTQNIPNNGTAARPSADPTRVGYDFVDWYTSATGGVPFDFANTPITENTVVHARWVPVPPVGQDTGLRWLADNITIPFDATYVDVLISLENVHTITNNVTMTLALGPDGATGATGLSIPAVPLQSHNTPNGVIVTPASALPAYVFSLEVKGPQTFASLDTTLLVRINTSAALLPNVPTTVRLSRPHISPHATEITTFTITRLPEGPIYHDVTFDLQGGGLAANFPTLTVLNNDTIARPTAVPTRTNYTFVDWYDAVTGGDPFDFTAPITGPTTIYARWTPVLHPVTFNLHGGTGNFPVQNVPHNGTATQPPTEPTLTGFDFVGWYNAATGGAPFNFTTQITGPTTVHARWIPIDGNHLVTFNLHGGTGNAPNQSVPNNGTATRPPVNPTRAGYNFVNWYTAATGGTAFNFATPITADTVIHARWAVPTPPGPGPGQGGPGPSGPGGHTPQQPQDPTPPADDNDNDNENDNDNDNEVLIPIDPTPVIYTHYAYMIGFEDGTVRPQANITRAEATTIFFRLISDTHRSGIWSRDNGFSDVAVTGWYNTAISTMDNGGFVAGYPDGTFRPNQSITRAEMTALVVRFMGYGHLTDVQGNTFSDAQGHWAQDAITVASRRGWVTGFEDGTFRPDQPITRAEAAALVNRMLGRLPQNSDDLLNDMLTWPDNMNVNAWYYLYIQEATNSHYHEMKADGIHETWTQLIAPRDWRSLELLD